MGWVCPGLGSIFLDLTNLFLCETLEYLSKLWARAINRNTINKSARFQKWKSFFFIGADLSINVHNNDSLSNWSKMYFYAMCNVGGFSKREGYRKQPSASFTTLLHLYFFEKDKFFTGWDSDSSNCVFGNLIRYDQSLLTAVCSAWNKPLQIPPPLSSFIVFVMGCNATL